MSYCANLQADDAEEAAEGGPDAKKEDGKEAESHDGNAEASSTRKEDKDGSQDSCNDEEEGGHEYEFTQWEERVLEASP